MPKIAWHNQLGSTNGHHSRASISIATAVYNTQPFMLVALGALFMRERLTTQKLARMALAFLGMLLIVQAKPNASYIGTDYFTGISMALGAAACYAVAAITTKMFKGVPPHLIALIQVMIGVIMLAPLGALAFIYPIVAIIVDVIAFGHRLQPAQLAGAVAILLAAAGTTLGWTLRKRSASAAAAALSDN